MKVPAVATFAMYRGVSTYIDRKKAVKELDCGTRAFNALSRGTEKGVERGCENQEKRH